MWRNIVALLFLALVASVLLVGIIVEDYNEAGERGREKVCEEYSC